MKLLTVGIVRTVHGVRGALKVRSLSGEIDHFRTMEAVWLAHKSEPDSAARRFDVQEVSGSPHALILKLEGMDSPEHASQWRGARVLAPRENAARRGEDEFYVADLVGCKLLFEERPVASVVGVWDSGSSDMLEVRTESGLRNVPFRKEFVGWVDIENQRIELLVDWILE
ncbi:MAG: ribosome maturation factor RimM [Spirochaetota bacterium]